VRGGQEREVDERLRERGARGLREEQVRGGAADVLERGEANDRDAKHGVGPRGVPERRVRTRYVGLRLTEEVTRAVERLGVVGHGTAQWSGLGAPVAGRAR